MTVSLIIPTYNRGAVLCDTVRMALDQISDGLNDGYEVIVVDQSEIVESHVQAYLDSVAASVRYIRLTTPNLPAARNAGVRAATGDIVVFIDDDVQIQCDYLVRHTRHYKDPKVGAVMGSLVEGFDGAAEPCSDRPSVEAESRSMQAEVTTVDWVIGGNTSYRREALERVGLCDELYSGTAWCEDADLSIRVRHSGFKLLLDRRIELVHLKLPSGGCNNRDAARQEAVAEEQLQHYVYFIIKNRHILGFGEACRGLGRAYRKCVLNRTVARLGLRAFARKHLTYWRVVARAYHRLALSDAQ